MSHEGIRVVPKDQVANEIEADRPLPRISITPEKVRVLLTEGKGLEIDWSDGHKPGEPRPKPAALLPLYTAPAKPASAHAVGRYALQFNWEDGHTSGIYSWDYLRRSCQCRECTFVATEPSGSPN